ncbi:hypothetical protein GCM10009087_42170 [Sphingomonas oligophenolica]|uniref:GtrA family protein n=1 Tax=Sphingomonas oligophenolica TaxID=301154 RepID=A0ABU9YCU0_9SPHN
MIWFDEAAYFLGGGLLANAVPHLVRGMTGHSFQSPFATPSGKGLSSSTVNVLWGFLNLAAAYGLLFWVGSFSAKSFDILAAAIGALLIGLFSARHFGGFHGGNLSGPA